MHAESLTNMQRFHDTYVAPHLPLSKSKLTLVDIGSMNENGTYRDIFPESAFAYVGVDLAAGDGVDVVADDPYAYPLPDNHADIVISGQMMEHCEFFWLAFDEMMRIAKPGGLIVSIVPSCGPIHRYPVDCYRFLPDSMAALAKHAGCDLLESWHDEESPWGDVVGIFKTPAPTPGQIAAERASTYGGEPYVSYLAAFLEARGSTAHLEIGTFHGQSLAPLTCTTLAIDPEFHLRQPIMGQKPAAFLFQMTSDAFFAEHDPTYYLRGPVTSAFLDGLHLFEALLRDLINTEQHCTPDGVIFLHDCLPLTVEMTTRVHADVPLDGPYPGWWTGDVWKVVPILRKYRPDLEMTFLDCPPTGLVMLTRLNPQDRTLQENYDSILAEFMDQNLTDESLAAYLASCPLRSSKELLAP